MRANFITCRSREIAEKLKNQILQGAIPLSSPLPSIRKTAEKYAVSTQVITSAMKILEQENLIQSFPRRGFRVVEKLPGGKVLLLTAFTASNALYIHYHMIPELEKRCAGKGYTLEKLPLEVLREGNPKNILRQLRKKDFCGVFLCDGSYIGNEPEIALLRELNIPVVMPLANWGDRDVTGFAAVENDLDRCWKTALRYLVSKGCRHIGAIGTASGTLANGGPLLARLGCHPIGYHFQLFRDLQIETPQDPLLFLELNAPMDHNLEQIRQWLRQPERFDAILCYTGFLAPLVYKVCQEKKLSIPKDLAVIGIGEYPGLEMLDPPLTTSGRPVEQSAEAAIRLLQSSACWFGTGESPVIANPPEIFPRKSTDRKLEI